MRMSIGYLEPLVFIIIGPVFTLQNYNRSSRQVGMRKKNKTKQSKKEKETGESCYVIYGVSCLSRPQPSLFEIFVYRTKVV